MRLVFRSIVFLTLCALVWSLAPSRTFAAPPAGAPETYTVQSGDTLFSIATRFHTTVAELKQLNGLKNDTILVGQKLLVPSAADSTPQSTTAYIVEPGDTIYRIALQFGTTARALQDLNGIPNPNLISVGQALAIPANGALVKPGLTLDPPTAQQGGTLLLRLARPELASVTGVWGNEKITFTRGAGYWYALTGVSRCAKLGTQTIQLTETDAAGAATTENASFTVAATAFPVQNIVLPPSKGGLLDPTLDTREAQQLYAIVAPHTPTRLWSGVFRQPLVGIVSAYFGSRRSYNGGPVGACGHEGMDLAIPEGTPIYSDARGRVVFADLTQVRGNMTVVDHGLGVYSAYYHQSEIDVKVGQMVNPGELIGKVGTTGLSTGNHLHWSIFVNGEYVDPVEWTRRVVP